MKEKIIPHTIAKPVGPYTHVIRVSAKQFIFVAGQVPVDKDGNVVGVNPSDKLRNHQTIDLSMQVRQTLQNVKDALEAGGASLNDLVRVDTYVVASAMNEYRTVGVKTKHEVLSGVNVGGATVFVAGLMIPDALIEVSAIAAIGSWDTTLDSAGGLDIFVAKFSVDTDGDGIPDAQDPDTVAEVVALVPVSSF